jgi:hypothetical protein
MDIEKVKTDIELGKRIFESVPSKFRPGLGTSLLMTFDNSIKVPTEVTELYEIVEDEKKWSEAHQQFNKIRVFLLTHKRFAPETFLLLAEKVAKVTYNLSGYPAPFDKDSGWYIPSLAMQTAHSFKDKILADEVIRILGIYYKADTNAR